MLAPQRLPTVAHHFLMSAEAHPSPSPSPTCMSASYSPTCSSPTATRQPSFPPKDSNANASPGEPWSSWAIQESGDPPVVRRQPGQRVDVSPIPRPDSPYPRGAVFSGFGDESSDEEETASDRPYVAAVSDSGMRLRIKNPDTASLSPSCAEVVPSPPRLQPLESSSQDEPVSRGLSEFDTASLTKSQLAALQRLSSVHDQMTQPADGELTDRRGLKLLRAHQLALARAHVEMQAERRRAMAHARILGRSVDRRRIVSAVIRKCHHPPAFLSQRFHVDTDSPPQAPVVAHSS